MLSAAALAFRDGLLTNPCRSDPAHYSMIENLLTFLASSGCPQMMTPRKLVLNLSPKISFQSYTCYYTGEDPENMEKLRKDTEVLQWDGCCSITTKQSIKSEGGSLSAVPKGSLDLPPHGSLPFLV